MNYQFLISILRRNKFFSKMDGSKSQLTLVEKKSGTVRFASNSGIAAMTTLHVWKQDSSETYQVQYSQKSCSQHYKQNWNLFDRFIFSAVSTANTNSEGVKPSQTGTGNVKP